MNPGPPEPHSAKYVLSNHLIFFIYFTLLASTHTVKIRKKSKIIPTCHISSQFCSTNMPRSRTWACTYSHFYTKTTPPAKKIWPVERSRQDEGRAYLPFGPLGEPGEGGPSKPLPSGIPSPELGAGPGLSSPIATPPPTDVNRTIRIATNHFFIFQLLSCKGFRFFAD